MERRSLSQYREQFSTTRVRAGDTLQQVVAAVLDHPELREVCVVDPQDRLLGVIDTQRLFSTLFFHYTDRNLLTRQLMALSSSETAAHLMRTEAPTARESETLGHAIEKMVRHGLGDLPIVDEHGKLLGSISINLIFRLWLESQASS